MVTEQFYQSHRKENIEVKSQCPLIWMQYAWFFTQIYNKALEVDVYGV